MKSLKGQLIAAIAMTLVAIVTITSSTYAWFSMNTSVSATGMEVKAKAEGGIVIAAYTHVDTSPYWSTPASTAYASTAAAKVIRDTDLYPTSTPKGSQAAVDWWHSSSSSVDSSIATAAYEKLTLTAHTGKDASGSQYYLLNKFAVKATDDGTYPLYVKSIAINTTKPTGTTGSAELDKAVRIALKIGTNVYFFAPNYESGTDVTKLYYYSGSGTTRTAYANGDITVASTGLSKQISTSISSSVTDIEVYIYYEGEDENCKSINAVNIDTLSLDINFSTAST